ncbi:DUF6297 family protein [Nonomuraea sediminis]|uniref:DUF6297 family protein n=1 Tax=Nonomuraea sediminis TaxID=2835864 RepID=UPI001BDD6F04|nr:DUF6297 family protein [Nonomuraea sediminis]
MSAEVRAFLAARRRARASVLDRYVAGFALVVGAMVLGPPITSLLSGLVRQADPAQAGPGVALVLLAVAGFAAAARAAGPVAVPGADASWLLLTPLDRRAVLGRTARVLLAVSVVAGLALGLALLAALGAPGPVLAYVIQALVLGVAMTVGAMALAVLSQSSQTWHTWLTITLVVLVAAATLAATGLWHALPDLFESPARSATLLHDSSTDLLHGSPQSADLLQSSPLSTSAGQARALPVGTADGQGLPSGFAWVVVVVGAVAVLVRRAWVALGRIPAAALLRASTRAGHAASAAFALDPGALTWIVEDNHWRARTFRSRPWPALPAPLALAWHDWRRVARRPGRLAVLFATATLPWLLARAGAAEALLGVSVIAGALLVASTATAGARRDADNPAMARLLGVDRRRTLAARAILPALLAATWSTIALTTTPTAPAALTTPHQLERASTAPHWRDTASTAPHRQDTTSTAPHRQDTAGVDQRWPYAASIASRSPEAAVGGVWGVGWLFGVAVAPAVAAGALRMARRKPVDHSMPVIDTPGGAIPTGPLMWAATGPDVAVLGSLPALAALATGTQGPGLLAAQAVLGLATLAVYVMRAR